MKSDNGFTLIEILIYTGLVIIISVATTQLLKAVLDYMDNIALNQKTYATAVSRGFSDISREIRPLEDFTILDSGNRVRFPTLPEPTYYFTQDNCLKKQIGSGESFCITNPTALLQSAIFSDEREVLKVVFNFNNGEYSLEAFFMPRNSDGN